MLGLDHRLDRYDACVRGSPRADVVACPRKMHERGNVGTRPDYRSGRGSLALSGDAIIMRVLAEPNAPGATLFGCFARHRPRIIRINHLVGLG